MNQPPTTPRPGLVALVIMMAALLASGGFLYMVKLMHDMTGHMGDMSSQVHSMAEDMRAMRVDMGSLARDVSDMTKQVRTLPAMAVDLGRMREGMEQLSGMVGRGGEQLEQMNPMGVIQQMIPGTRR
jgi:hypothetical protein